MTNKQLRSELNHVYNIIVNENFIENKKNCIRRWNEIDSDDVNRSRRVVFETL